MDFKLRGVKVESATESFERVAQETLDRRTLASDPWCLRMALMPREAIWQSNVVFDVLLSVLLLILTGPLMAIIAALIKLDTPGPAIFSQERVGLRGKKFVLHKFRSMRQDAEKQTGPTWAKENDDA